MPDLTSILNATPDPDRPEAEAHLAAIYRELHTLAQARMAGERDGHTLQPTALVHEAYLRLMHRGGSWENRRHFFGAASEAMRRILIESARRRAAVKRGSGAEHLPLSDTVFPVTLPDDKLLQVHDALDTLEAEDALKAEIVKLHVFVGLGHAEAAALLGLGERTVRRHWQMAKVRLLEIIRREDSSSGTRPQS